MNNFNLTKYLSKNLLLEDDRESMINHYAHKLAAGEEVSDEFFFDNEATIRDAANAIEKWSNSDTDMDEAQMPKKMTRNKLKELIKSAYLEEDDDVGLKDKYTVDFNEAKKGKDEDKEEVEDDITIDDTEDIDIEAPAPASDSEFIASLESLKQQAESLNDPKLIRLLNNTITYYTRNHIVDDESDTMGLAEEENNDIAFIEKLEATLNESNSSKNKKIMKESLEILKMKKLAGLLSEGQYSKALLREMEETAEGIKVEWSKDKLKDIFMTDKYYEKGLLDTSTMMGGKKVKEIVGYFEDENGEEDEETIGYVYSTSGDIDMISQDTLWDAFYNSLTSTKKSYRTGLKEMGGMKIFDLKDQNDASTELFKIENFTTVEEAIAALESYLGGKGLYTKATGAGYNYAYVASDGSVTFVKSLGEFSDGYQTEEEWGVASTQPIN